MNFRKRFFISIILIFLICFFSIYTNASNNQLINRKRTSNKTIIWNITTSGNIINNNEIVGFADGTGNITLNYDFTIKNNETLIIEPGVNIIFNKERYYYSDEFNFIIEGKLKAIGTITNFITFRLKEIKNAWINIKFSNFSSSSQSILKNCKIECGIINCFYSSPTISNNFLSSCRIECFHSSPLINYNIMETNSTILCYYESSPIIENNIIGNDTLTSYDGIKVYENSNPIITNNSISKCKNGISFSDTSLIYIENNTIYNNSGCGITSWWASPGIIRNNIIKNNEKYGIHCPYSEIFSKDSGIIIENNIIIFNKFNGINCQSPDVRIENNTIDANEQNGIECINSNPFIYNNNIINNSKWGILSSYKKLTKISNNSFKNNLGYNNKKGIRCQKWKLIINVFDLNGNAISEAEISVYNKFKELIAQNKSLYNYDAQGFYCSVIEYYIDNNNSLISCNPYSIITTINNINKSFNFTIEKNEEINISLNIELPDLNITEIYFRWRNESTIDILYLGENTGVAKICSKVEFYIDSILIYSYNESCFMPGFINRKLKVWNVDFGKHIMKVILDGNNLINETNEENNIYQIFIEIFPNGSIIYFKLQDFDNDGVIDIEDQDDDNDGYNDTIEELLETNPYDNNSYPNDFDNDLITDEFDFDDDNDNYSDEEELMNNTNPYDPEDYPDDISPIDEEDDGGNNTDEKKSQPVDFTFFIISGLVIIIFLIILALIINQKTKKGK